MVLRCYRGAPTLSYRLRGSLVMLSARVGCHNSPCASRLFEATGDGCPHAGVAGAAFVKKAAVRAMWGLGVARHVSPGCGGDDGRLFGMPKALGVAQAAHARFDYLALPPASCNMSKAARSAINGDSLVHYDIALPRSTSITRVLVVAITNWCRTRERLVHFRIGNDLLDLAWPN